MKKSFLILSSFALVLFFSCKKDVTSEKNVTPIKKIVRQQPKSISYQLQNTKEWLKNNSGDSTKLDIAYAVNRTDKTNFKLLDSVVIPADMAGDLAYFLPFPLEVSYLKEVNKIIFFSYPSQTFATYENGQLIYTGPTNMGRKQDQTPRGLFFTNWKAETTTSTFDDEWQLNWNFNIENKLGVGWHEYELPGYPASHSCLRLQKKDAQYLYEWADQWVLKDPENIQVKGTPVIVFGDYDFNAKKPWLQLVSNPKVLNISEGEIEKQTMPFLATILKEQKIRQEYQNE